MPTINMHEAKSQLSRLVDAVESGLETEVIIARNGKPAARLVPISASVDVSRRIGGGRALFGAVMDDTTLAKFNEVDEDVAALFYGERE
ncbi:MULTISPECIES: type II toxin-antitoxin system prevent-host-death family antitoxin [Cupriavidus]|jgi:prevent-host-death family protein|uniref:type II toxin-antitoxin system Phd/YefM family antitoxin n=1 Tax=unclassified Cupriavidus TaxID=2640874 RepID=UPI003F912638